MARLTARARRRLPAKAFAYPPTKSRRGMYPIHDAGHRTAALREAAKKSTFGTYRHVKAQVCKRAPGMATCSKTTSSKRGRR